MCPAVGRKVCFNIGPYKPEWTMHLEPCGLCFKLMMKDVVLGTLSQTNISA